MSLKFNGTTELIEDLTAIRTVSVTMSGTAIDLSAGTYFIKEISANTTFTVTNVPASTVYCSFQLELSKASAYIIQWFSGIVWEGGALPALGYNKTVLEFSTVDGGTTWYGKLVGASLNGDNGWFNLVVSPTENTYSYSLAVNAAGDVFHYDWCDYKNLLIKYNSAGVVQWSRVDLGYDASYVLEDMGQMVLDSSENMYLTAFISSSVVVANYAALLKYNSAGELLWQRQLYDPANTNSEVRFWDVAVDSSDNVYIAGHVVSSGYVYLIKYNSAGVLQWQKSLSATSTSIKSWGINIDSSDNVYMSGYIDQSGAFAGMLIKYNSSGTLQWQRRLDATGPYTNVLCYRCTTDASGNIYVVGEVRISTGPTDMIVVKYNSSGTLQWQRTLGRSSLDGSVSELQAVQTDSSGNVYIVGYGDSVDGGDSTVYRPIIAKFDSSGNLQWQKYVTYYDRDNVIVTDMDLDTNNLYFASYNYSPSTSTCAKIPLTLLESTTGGISVDTTTYMAGQQFGLIPGYQVVSSTAAITSSASSFTAGTGALTDEAASLVQGTVEYSVIQQSI